MAPEQVYLYSGRARSFTHCPALSEREIRDPNVSLEPEGLRGE